MTWNDRLSSFMNTRNNISIIITKYTKYANKV